MRHGRLKGQLGVKKKHRLALMRNLVRGLVIHKRIQTTFRKAKIASSFADSMVELAKRGDLHARRLLIARLGCPDTANTLIKQVAPQFKERKGGYTRVLRLGTRRAGDGTELALLEFTAIFESTKKPKKPKKETKAAQVEEAPKPKKEKAKTSEKKEETKASASEKKSKAADSETEKKESEKKGGFLGKLRKFLKGDEESK